jgi:Ca2+-binding RTX toxin-like protein
LVGGSDDDTLLGADKNTTWKITGPNTGPVGSLAFVNVENFVGGAGDDVFKMESGGSLAGVINQGAGVNNLDYSALTTTVLVNLSLGQASALGGISAVRDVTGGSGKDRLVGVGQDNTLDGNGGNNILLGGAGNDTLLCAGGLRQPIGVAQSKRVIVEVVKNGGEEALAVVVHGRPPV